MFDKPPEVSGIEFFFNTVVQRSSALLISKVHVSTFEREELGRFESFPAPASEKRCVSNDDVNLCARTNQDIQNVEVFPPAGGKQTSSGRFVNLRSAFQQELHQRQISCAGYSKKQNRT